MDFLPADLNNQITLSALAVLSLPVIIRYVLRYLAFREKLRQLKNRVTVVAEYSAPPNIPPAFFGVLIDNRISLNDYYATILWLHVKGLLDIQFIEERNDFKITYVKGIDTVTFEHEKYALDKFAYAPNGITWAQDMVKEGKKDKGLDAMYSIYGFQIALQRDLQKEGYYKFGPYLQYAKKENFFHLTVFWALMKGLVKPWNWPLFALSYVFPFVGVVWFFFTLWFYNRLGLYGMKTDKWEATWPSIAGYYNYLVVAESQRRSHDLGHNPALYKMSPHDPYLAAGLQQSKWFKVFSPIRGEIGAGGKEYNTL